MLGWPSLGESEEHLLLPVTTTQRPHPCEARQVKWGPRSPLQVQPPPQNHNHTKTDWSRNHPSYPLSKQPSNHPISSLWSTPPSSPRAQATQLREWQVDRRPPRPAPSSPLLLLALAVACAVLACHQHQHPDETPSTMNELDQLRSEAEQLKNAIRVSSPSSICFGGFRAVSNILSAVFAVDMFFSRIRNRRVCTYIIQLFQSWW